ncbi:hypothetical protein SNE40_019864 [Patella caerulea]|uniref:Uncharacterized protein n=1 Tax=Patella caerulea TaxID=87958 RepID=A0AAN8G9I5_PATCE
MNFYDRRKWVWNNVQQSNIKRVTAKRATSRRRFTYTYRFRTPEESGGGLHDVCKPFFLSTLGYDQKSDSAIMRCLQSAPSDSLNPNSDQRGKHVPNNKLDQIKIFAHIFRYNPSVHHYRREHAPNRLYLPSEITIKDMHEHYVQNIEKISIESYGKCVVAKNISFTVLGSEECEECKKFHEHKKTHENGSDIKDCEQCLNHDHHIKRRDETRIAYKSDVEKSLLDETYFYSSADLQKVIMLPGMPGEKTSAFTRRIVAFNETFASLGQTKTKVTALWHEAISGRNASDIASTFWNFFKQHLRDKKHIVIAQLRT